MEMNAAVGIHTAIVHRCQMLDVVIGYDGIFGLCKFYSVEGCQRIVAYDGVVIDVQSLVQCPVGVAQQALYIDAFALHGVHRIVVHQFICSAR